MKLRQENDMTSRVVLYAIAFACAVLIAQLARCMTPVAAQESTAGMVLHDGGVENVPQERPSTPIVTGIKDREETLSLLMRKPGDDRALELARACYAEASYSKSDCAAIHFMVARRADRAGELYSVMLRRYTAIDRSQRVPIGAKWEALQAYAARVHAGYVADPCPRSMHFGGHRIAKDHARMYRMVASGRWRVLRCNPHTLNTFLGPA